MAKLSGQHYLQKISASMKGLKLEVYRVYGDDACGKPSIHISTENLGSQGFNKLITAMGLYNFSSPEKQFLLRPHNYGGFEAYLSLEPETACTRKDLRLFSNLLKSFAEKL